MSTGTAGGLFFRLISFQPSPLISAAMVSGIASTKAMPSGTEPTSKGTSTSML